MDFSQHQLPDSFYNQRLWNRFPLNMAHKWREAMRAQQEKEEEERRLARQRKKADKVGKKKFF